MRFKVTALLFIVASAVLTVLAPRPDGHTMGAVACLAVAAGLLAEGWWRETKARDRV